MTPVVPPASTPTPVQLSLGSRAAMRARHGVRLGREVARHGREQRLWWLLPVVVFLLMFAVAIFGSTTVVPVAVYTLF